MSQKRPTLKEIAAIAKVTPTTVSLALRDHPRISEATRQRVREVAAQLGYRRDANLAHLMRHLRIPAHRKEYPVLALVSDLDRRMDADPHPNSTWKGFSGRAEALGYSPQEFPIKLDGLSAPRLQSILEARGIGGVIFAALRSPEFVKGMDLSRFACAAIGNALRDPMLHRATSDKFSNTVLLCEHLWASGYRRIGLVIPKSQEIRVEDTFLGGYLTFHFRHQHGEWGSPIAYEGEWNQARILDWVKETRPDAVVAAYAGLRRYLAEHLPSTEIPYVCLINHEGDSSSPGISQRHDLIAAAAVNMVDAQLGRHELGIPETANSQIVRGTWVEASESKAGPLT